MTAIDVVSKHHDPHPDAEVFSHVVLVTGSRTWSDEQVMRRAFRDAWLAWGAESVTRPLLVSGHCPTGADSMAERLWLQAGFEVVTFPADWSGQGRGAGFDRNQAMVDAALVFRAAGAQVRCTAFLDPCRKEQCSQRGRQQLMPQIPGHFSHGTVHCRSRALAAGIEVLDVFGSGC